MNIGDFFKSTISGIGTSVSDNVPGLLNAGLARANDAIRGRERPQVAISEVPEHVRQNAAAASASAGINQGLLFGGIAAAVVGVLVLATRR